MEETFVDFRKYDLCNELEKINEVIKENSNE